MMAMLKMTERVTSEEQKRQMQERDRKPEGAVQDMLKTLAERGAGDDGDVTLGARYNGRERNLR
jgi:hypothetical protein